MRTGWTTFGLLLYRLTVLFVWTVLALPGVVLNAPMFLLASSISRKKAKEALAASTVKVEGRDVLATWKIMISVGIAPVMYILYAALATAITIRMDAPPRLCRWTPFLTIFALPIMSYASLKFGEAGLDILKSLRPLVVALIPGQQKSLDRLKRMRLELSNEVTELTNELGPKIWDDFDNFRILVPSASAPPSSGRPGIWRRKSSIGGVDAQGALLAHPMTWLDERLFGWSRSAARGTSAWGGPPSQMPSRSGTPDVSDSEEDGGDYEHVLGYVPSDFASRPPSQRGSFADLQQLKMSNGLTPDDIETWKIRSGSGLRHRVFA